MLSFELVSPAKRLSSSEADSVTVPGIEGDMTAMENHAPFLTTLRPGFLTVRTKDSEERFFLTGGFAEICDNVVSVLAEDAVAADAVTAAWLDGQISEAEQDVDSAPEDRKPAARQRVNDFVAVKSMI